MKNKSFQKRATKITLACSILAATVSFGASASAFSDMKGHASESKINALHQNGIINGITSDRFAPKSKLTYAQGLQFIVSGLKLSPQNTTGSKASDYFDKVKDNAWYASAFVVRQAKRIVSGQVHRPQCGNDSDPVRSLADPGAAE